MCQVLWIQWHSFASEELTVEKVNSVITHVNVITNGGKSWGWSRAAEGHFRKQQQREQNRQNGVWFLGT